MTHVSNILGYLKSHVQAEQLIHDDILLFDVYVRALSLLRNLDTFDTQKSGTDCCTLDRSHRTIRKWCEILLLLGTWVTLTKKSFDPPTSLCHLRIISKIGTWVWQRVLSITPQVEDAYVGILVYKYPDPHVRPFLKASEKTAYRAIREGRSWTLKSTTRSLACTQNLSCMQTWAGMLVEESSHMGTILSYGHEARH